jgi:hypothetical protein
LGDGPLIAAGELVGSARGRWWVCIAGRCLACLTSFRPTGANVERRFADTPYRVTPDAVAAEQHLEPEITMAKFITIGYGDEAGYQRTAQAVRDAAHAQDARLRAQGALIGIAGAPVQVRNPDDSGVQTTQGSFLRSDLPIAGFAVIDADDLPAAIRLMSKVPCAVAHGVVEVWPLQDM